MGQRATNDLQEVSRLAIVCDDCGRRRVWRAPEIARAQLRWGVRSAVQLGTRLTCNHCSERGHGGHNVSIYPEHDQPVGQHPNAKRRLCEAVAVTSTCSDCGHQVRLDRAALDEMPAVRTFGELWRGAYCPPCRAAGAAEPNVVLDAEWAVPAAAVKASVAWSTKEVFGEDRTSPFPNLPPSRLMRSA